MPKKKDKKTRKVKATVEDHGNGFMVVGVSDPVEARKILKRYVDDIKPYDFACPTYYEDQRACWLSTHPGATWDGATYPTGEPIPR